MTHDHEWQPHVGAFPKPPEKVENTIGLNEAWMVVACQCGKKQEITLYSRGPWTAEAVRNQLATDLTPEALKRAALKGTRHCAIVDGGEVCGKHVARRKTWPKRLAQTRYLDPTEKEAPDG